MGFHLLSSSPGFLPLALSSSSSGVGIPGMVVKARARRDRCVWGIVRGRTRRCRVDDAVVSLCTMNGRNDDMIAQRQTTNSIKRATAVWGERVLSWIDETPGVKTAYTTASAWQFLHLYPPCFGMLLEHSNARRLTQPEFQRENRDCFAHGPPLPRREGRRDVAGA
jgi:hypothetical protein